jgi:hypothetical protein
MSLLPNTAHSEVWTIEDLRAYAESLGYTIELTPVSEGGRK